MSPPHASRLAALSVTLVLGLTLAGCSSDEGAEEGGRRTRMDASDVLGTTFRLRTSISRVLGELSQPQREKLEREARQLLTGYLEASYLRDRPTAGQQDAFPGFTPGARELALQDVDTLSDAAFADADEVRARGAVAFLSVVAAHGRPVGATARVFLDLTASTRGRDRLLEVRGRLLLSPVGDDWRIFGYDLALGPAPGSAPVSGGAR